MKLFDVNGTWSHDVPGKELALKGIIALICTF